MLVCVHACGSWRSNQRHPLELSNLFFERWSLTGTQGSAIKLGWLVTSPTDPPVSASPVTGLQVHTAKHSFLTWVLWSKLDSSEWQAPSLPSYLPSLPTNHLSNKQIQNIFIVGFHSNKWTMGKVLERSVTRIPSSGDKVKVHWPWFSVLTVLRESPTGKGHLCPQSGQTAFSWPFPRCFLAPERQTWHSCSSSPAQFFLLRPLCSASSPWLPFVAEEGNVPERESLRLGAIRLPVFWSKQMLCSVRGWKLGFWAWETSQTQTLNRHKQVSGLSHLSSVVPLFRDLGNCAHPHLSKKSTLRALRKPTKR